MPAEEIEIVEAEEEGVIFKNLTNPIEVIPGEDGKVQKVRLQIMELGEPDASGRRRPVPVEGQEEIIDVDNIIVAIGQGIDPAGFEDLELTKWNTIVVDTETFATNLEGVFAGGDCVNDGASIAIQAIGDAENAVPFINAYLENKEMTYKKPYYVTREDLDEEYFVDRIKALRPPMGHISPDDRKTTFEEFVAGYTPEQAKEEAMRCLECGCHDYFECKLVDYANEYDVEPERLAGENKEIEFNDDHPYIMRDPNKCILCGLCVRVCDELMGISALGLVERGFDTLVLPSLGMPLQETGCISCGQCINVCPTGALGERTQVAKPVPVDTVKTKTVCGYCSAGCEMVVESMGNTIIKAVPVNESRNNGIMCGRGRFGTDKVQRGERIIKPYIRKNGELQESEWYDAFVYTIKKAQSLKAKYGEKGLVLSTGAKNTLEDVYSINKLADALNAPVTSHDDIDNEIYSMKDYNEITGSDVLIVLDLAPSTNPLILQKLREAKKAGATIFAVNAEETSVHKIGEEITCGEGLTLAKEVLAYLQDENADVSAQAKQWASAYQSAKQKMVIAGSNGVEDLAFAIAQASGQQQVPRQGVLKVYSKCNTAGLMAMGVKSIDTMDYKGLMIFGEDVEKLADGIEFLMVQDTHMTDTALQADVVFPALSFPEINGSFLNGEGRLMKVKKTVKTPIPLKNWELPLELLKIMEMNLGYRCYREIDRDIRKEYPLLKDVKEDECIKIECAVKEIPEIVDASFEVVMTTDYLMNKMNEELFAVIKH
jgi:formate dehydrogenase major subunit